MQTKTVYLFNDSGEYVGTYLAQRSPMFDPEQNDPGEEFIAPVNSLAAPPPELQTNKVAVAVDGAWTVQPDFRGVALYSTADGAPVAVTEIGAQPPDTTEESRPSASHVWSGEAWERPLATARADAIKQIDVEVDALIGAVIGNRATEYERAETQAIAFAAGGYVGPVPACVQSWADAKVAQDWTPQMAADDILATANAWRPAQEAIRAQRLLRKEQARTAADVAGVDAVLAQWAGFLAAIKGQLGV